MQSPFKADMLEGKVALVTGGGSGIGYEISLQLGQHSASVVIMGRGKHVLELFLFLSHGFLLLGLMDAARTVESTFKHFGWLDNLINAAARNLLEPAEDLFPNCFPTVDIDSIGIIRMIREALKYHKEGVLEKDRSSGGTKIKTSVQIYNGVTWSQFHASPAKAAVVRITRSLALDWGADHDIAARAKRTALVSLN